MCYSKVITQKCHHCPDFLHFDDFFCVFEILAFWHAGTCFTLLFNAVEENLRGLNDRKNERHTLGLFYI